MYTTHTDIQRDIHTETHTSQISISTTLATSAITIRNTNVDHMYNALFHKTGEY